MSDVQFGYFDRMTPSYGDDRLQFAVDEILADGRDGSSVLDIGCGDGSILEFLKASGVAGSLHGVDPAERYVRLARARGIDAVRGSVFDVATLDAHRNQHDYVVMASVLHHLVHERSWNECRRLQLLAVRNALAMLVDDGKLLIFEPCTEPRWVNRAAFEVKSRVIRLGTNRRIDIGWINLGAPLVAFFTPDELQQTIVESSGRTLRSVVIGRRRRWPATRSRFGLVVRRRS